MDTDPIRQQKSLLLSDLPHIRVTLVESERPPKTLGMWFKESAQHWKKDRLALALLLGGGSLFIFLAILWWYCFRTTVPAEVHLNSGLVCAITIPDWAAPGDEDKLIVTLTNHSNVPLTVTAHLVFSDTTYVLTSLEGSTVLEFGDLAPRECKTREIRFCLSRTQHHHPVPVMLHLDSPDATSLGEVGPYYIRTLPITRFKTTLLGTLKALGALLIGVLTLLRTKILEFVVK